MLTKQEQQMKKKWDEVTRKEHIEDLAIEIMYAQDKNVEHTVDVWIKKIEDLIKLCQKD